MPPDDINDVIEMATKEVKRASTETKQALDAANKRMDALETAFKRGGGSPGDEPASAEQIAYKAAFGTFLRYGEADGLKAQQKALSVGSDPDGGYLVPTELAARVIKRLEEISPLRRIASTITTASGDMEFLVDVDSVGAQWADEISTRDPSRTPQLGKKRIVVHELVANPLATQRLIEDSAIDLEAWLARKLQTQFAQTEGHAFTRGTGVGQPRGYLTYPDGTTGESILQVPSGAANGLTADALLAATYAIKSGYRANASWVMNRAAQLECRKLKDTSGQYLWQPSLQAGQPDRLAGYAIHESEDHPGFAPGSLSIAFGDWQEAYQIVDRLGMTVLRDPYSRKPYVEFAARKRVGGDVTNFEALVLIRTGEA